MFTKEEMDHIMERFKKKIPRLSNETLRIVLTNPTKAREFARKNMDKSVPENEKEIYLDLMVKAMREFAKTLLEKRKKSK